MAILTADGILIATLHGRTGELRTTTHRGKISGAKWTPRPSRGGTAPDPATIKYTYCDKEWIRIPHAQRQWLNDFAHARKLTRYLAFKRLFLTSPPACPADSNIWLSTDHNRLQPVPVDPPPPNSLFAGMCRGIEWGQPAGPVAETQLFHAVIAADWETCRDPDIDPRVHWAIWFVPSGDPDECVWHWTFRSNDSPGNLFVEIDTEDPIGHREWDLPFVTGQNLYGHSEGCLAGVWWANATFDVGGDWQAEGDFELDWPACTPV